MTSPNPAGPRPWLLRAPIPDGPHRLLSYLWTYGPHWQPDDPLPAHGAVEAWPTRPTAAEDLGRPINTIKKWIKWLTRHGWILRRGNAWALAVAEPCPEWLELADARAAAKTRAGSAQTPGGSTGTRVHTDPPQGPGGPCARVHTDPPQGPGGPPEPLTEPAIEPTSEPATRTAQLALVSPMANDEAAALRAEHERLRMLALHAHGKARTKLPAPTTKPGKALDSRLAKALREHGEAKCRAVLEHVARQWHDDPGRLPWSCEQVWSPKSLAVTFSRMGRSSGTGPRRWRGAAFDAPPNPRDGAEPNPASDLFADPLNSTAGVC